MTLREFVDLLVKERSEYMDKPLEFRIEDSKGNVEYCEPPADYYGLPGRGDVLRIEARLSEHRLVRTSK